MIIWINGAFGVGKSKTAELLQCNLKKSHIYDPEQVGYFLWDNFPKEMCRNGDFQDIPIWRSINFEIIKYLNYNFNGHLIIPMTIINPDYFCDIIGNLKKQGIKVYHFILTASKHTLINRLRNRGEQENSWPQQQIDRCLCAYDATIDGLKIDTDGISAEETAAKILQHIKYKIY